MNTRVAAQKWETSIRRRTLLTSLLCLGTLVGAGFLASPAIARATVARIDVIEVSGLLDPIQVDFMEASIREARVDRAAVVVIRLDSPGAVGPRQDVEHLVASIRNSPVPVAVWVGPGRESRADGAALVVYRAADVCGRVPGARVGGAVGGAAASCGLQTEPAAATLGDFIIGLDGMSTPKGVIDIPTTEVRRAGRPVQRQLSPSAQVRFDEPSLLGQLLHAVATPTAAYLLLVVGLLLVVFELFTAGIGVAAATAVLSLVLSFYGLGVLPHRPWAFALVVLGIVGHAIDVQSGAPRAWTFIGSTSFVAGSFFLFGDVSLPLAVLALVVAGVEVFMLAAMPAVVRTRFSTPTIGRESMLGERGVALSDIDPDGVVTIREAPWRARTNRATPVKAGDTVRVASIDGLLLEVEPLEGAARDAGH